MKKRIGITNLLLAFVIFGHAQTASIQFGIAGETASIINAADENNYFAVDLDGTGISCRKMGKKFESVKETTIELSQAEELKTYAANPGYTYNPNVLQYVFLEGDHLNVIYSILFKKQNKISFFLLKIKKGDLAADGSEKEIAVIKFDRLLQLSKAPADFFTSPDNSKILYYSNVPGKKADNERIHVILFNRKMEAEWEQTIDLGFKEDDFELENTFVDNNGNFILIGKEILNKKDPENPLYFKRHIYTYSDKGSVKTDHVFDQQYNDVKNWRTKLLKSGGKLVFAMRYESILKKGSKEKPNCKTILYTYDYTANSAENAYLSTELTTPDSTRFVLDALVETDDNHLLILYEKYEITPGSQQQGNIIYTWDDYYYDDIKIEKRTLKGELKWSSEIIKSQETRQSSRIFGSYGLRYLNGKLYIYYNDHAENKILAVTADDVKTMEVNFTELPEAKTRKKKEKVTEKVEVSKYFTHALCIIDGEGKVTKEILSNETEALLAPNTRFNNNSEIIMNYFDQEEFGLCKIIIK